MGALAMPHSKIHRMYYRTFWPVLLCLFWLAGIPAARAFKLAPITMHFEPSGRAASQAFRVENESEEQVAVQISILSRGMSLDGKEQNAPADDDFIVYPPQILLKPKQVQTLRVKWVGDARPQKELAYRILAEQLPINLSKEQETGAKINLIVRYLGSIYIVPKGAKPNVVIESALPHPAENGERKLAITFHNSGNAHTILRDLTLTLQANGKTVVLGPTDLEGISGENILAGNKRRFVLRWPAQLPDGPVEAKFTYHRRK